MKYDLKNNYKLECAEEYFSKLKEKKAMIELTEKRMPHSIDSHRLYRLWLKCIAVEIGGDENELHYLYRSTYLPKDEDDILKKLNIEFWNKVKRMIDGFQFFPGMHDVINIISYSTAIYIDNAKDNREFSEYLSNIQKHARVNFNIILLNLKDKNFEEFYREYGFR